MEIYARVNLAVSILTRAKLKVGPISPFGLYRPYFVVCIYLFDFREFYDAVLFF